MSIKIYNAYKLPKMSLDKLSETITTLKKEIYKKQIKKYKETIIKKSLEIYDHKLFYPDAQIVDLTVYSPHKTNILSSVKSYLNKNQKDLEEKNEMDEYYFHIYLFFHKKNMYAVTRELNSDFTNLFIKKTKAIPFEYWNNTDKPKNLSKLEWENRLKTWKSILGENLEIDTAPSLKLEFIFKTRFVDLNKINNKNIPKSFLKKESRLKKIAENLAFNSWFNKEKRDQDQCFRYLSTREYIEDRDTILKSLIFKEPTINIENILKQEITIFNEKQTENDYFL